MAEQETKTTTEPQTTETASGGASRKRRGLALPPKGQALSRLQDLEQDNSHFETDNSKAGETEVEGSAKGSNPSLHEGIDAVNTASSNAVNQTVNGQQHQDSDIAVPEANVSPPATSSRTESRPMREPTTRITVDMPDSLHRRISFLSVETRRSIKDLVIEALDATYFQPIPDQEK